VPLVPLPPIPLRLELVPALLRRRGLAVSLERLREAAARGTGGAAGERDATPEGDERMSASLPNQPRPKALAALEALIAQAEGDAEPLRLAVERHTAAGEDPGRAAALLRMMEDRLARLRESRRVLLEGEAEAEAGDEVARGKHAESARRSRERRKASSGSGGEP
jgi:hypothetical protein